CCVARSAQSSTLNTRSSPARFKPGVSGKLVNFQLPRGGQYWAAIDKGFGPGSGARVRLLPSNSAARTG
ncbi:MAG: hypothetical protein QOI89_3058, partial [Solirubrobacteraceae bacterium]|nr:hypothetical protein [Solirubrobacteraceae bacterium]